MATAMQLGNEAPEEYEINWTSDASGDASVLLSKGKGRRLRHVKTVPGAGVSAYTATLIDKDGVDWFGGEGAIRSTTDSEMFFADTEIILPSHFLTLTISGGGNVKTGTVIMRLE